MYCACLSKLTHALLRRIYVLCVLICVYYSNCIAIMSNICDRTDTCTCILIILCMIKYIRLCIVGMVV